MAFPTTAPNPDRSLCQALTRLGSALAAGSKKIARLSKPPKLCASMPFTSWLLCLTSHNCFTRYASFFPLLPDARSKKEKHAPLLSSFWSALSLNLMPMPRTFIRGFYYLWARCLFVLCIVCQPNGRSFIRGQAIDFGSPQLYSLAISKASFVPGKRA